MFGVGLGNDKAWKTASFSLLRYVCAWAWVHDCWIPEPNQLEILWECYPPPVVWGAGLVLNIPEPPFLWWLSCIFCVCTQWDWE